MSVNVRGIIKRVHIVLNYCKTLHYATFVLSKDIKNKYQH